jgi:hypothetical protein
LENKVRFQEYLSQIPIELAQTITLKNNLACNLYSKARLIELLSLKFRDKKFLTDLFNKLDDEQSVGIRSVLFYKDEEGIPISECHETLIGLFPNTKRNKEEIMNELVEYGLVLVFLNKRKVYCISMDLRDSLVEIIAQKAIEGVEFLPQEPTLLHQDPMALVHDIFTFLAFLKKGQVKLTQESLIFKRTQFRIFDAFELPEQPLEDDEKSVKGGYPERFDFIYKFCVEKQFIEITGNYLTLKIPVEDWLAKSDFEKVRDVFKFWQHTYLSSPSEAYLILKLLQQAPPDKWILQTSLLRILDRIIPKYLPLKPLAEARKGHFLSILLHVGCIEQSILRASGEELVGIRLSPLGRALLLNDENLFPYKNVETFSIQSNLEIIAPKNLDLSIRWYLNRLTDLLKVSEVLTYKLSRYSIYKTLQEGETADKIHNFLWKYAEKPLPDKVCQTFQEWTNTYGRIGFIDVFLLKCDSEALAKELKDSKRIHKFIVDEISPNHLIVKRKDYMTLLEILEEENYMPKPGVDRPSR